MRVITLLLMISMICCKPEGDRYYMSTNKDGDVYKIDKQTGEMWKVDGEELISLESGNEFRQTGAKTAAEELAMSQLTFGEFGYRTCKKCKYRAADSNHNHTNAECLSTYLKMQEGYVEVLPMSSTSYGDGNHVVEYRYKIDGKEFYYPIEVNMDIKSVKEINTISQRVRYYKSVEKFIRGIYQKHKISDAGISYEQFIKDMEAKVLRMMIYESIYKHDLSYVQFNNKLMISSKDKYDVSIMEEVKKISMNAEAVKYIYDKLGGEEVVKGTLEDFTYDLQLPGSIEFIYDKLGGEEVVKGTIDDFKYDLGFSNSQNSAPQEPAQDPTKISTYLEQGYSMYEAMKLVDENVNPSEISISELAKKYIYIFRIDSKL